MANTILERVSRWLKTDHTITLGLERKFVIIICACVLFWILVLNQAQDEVDTLNKQIHDICELPMIYGCEDLAQAKDYCSEAYYFYEQKNCSQTENLTKWGLLIQPTKFHRKS